jgi:predicted nucleic acid-binding protein
VAVTIFLDTSVLLAGLVDFGPPSAPAQSILHAVAEKALASPGTAWHCCLEFYSVATRLPPEFRLTPEDANELLREEVFGRLIVHDLPPGDRAGFFEAAARERIAGGRIYDAHIADVARAAGAQVIVTDNRRHFVSALRHGIKVETPSEFRAAMKTRRSQNPPPRG